MINVALNDILLFPELSGYTEEDLLDIRMDVKTLPYIYKLGIDTTQGYEFLGGYFRTLQDTVVLGYHVSGSMRKDKEWRKSPLCTVFDRLILSTKDDISLTRELCSLMNCSLDYRSFEDAEDEICIEDGESLKASNEVYEMNCKVQDIRGSSLGADGGMKKHEEYLSFIA